MEKGPGNRRTPSLRLGRSFLVAGPPATVSYMTQSVKILLVVWDGAVESVTVTVNV